MECHLRSMEAPLGEPRLLEGEVLDNGEIGPRLFRLRLRLPVEVDVEPAQFAMIRCDGGFSPPLLRRPFSIADARREGEGVHLDFLHRVVGPGTGALSGRRRGDRVSLLVPLGRGFRIGGPDGSLLHVMVAGGIGIAPFPLLARRLRGRGDRAVLLFGGRTAEEIAPLGDFEGLGVEVRVATEDGSLGRKGLVTVLLEDAIRRGNPAELCVYSCGPTPMLRAVEGLLRPHGVRHQVSLEERMACGFGVCVGCAVPVRAELLPGLGTTRDGAAYARACTEGPVLDGDEVLWEACPR